MSRDAYRRRHDRLIADLGILGAYIVLSVLLTWPLARDFGLAIPGDGFDGWQNFWNLWWVKRALVDLHTDPFFTSLLYYPTGVSLLFHTLNVFNGVVSLPIQLAFGLFPAYNAVVLLSFAMGGFGAYLLTRQSLGTPGNRLPAFAAGAVFTYSPFHFAHLLGHMQVISLEWIPFFALYLLRIVRPAGRPQVGTAGSAWKEVLLAALFLSFVGLCDLYYVLYCLIFTSVVLIWVIWRAWITQRRAAAGSATHRTAERGGSRNGAVAKLARMVGQVAAVWIIFAVVLGPRLVPMVAEARHSTYMVPDPLQSRILSADLAAFVTPQEQHPLWGRWAAEKAKVFAASASEHQVFAGFTVLALAAGGLWIGWHGRGTRKVDLGPWPPTLLVFFLLSLGPVLHIGGRTALLPGGGEVPLPYGWFASAVPFMEITRSVSRFDVMVMLSLGVLASIAISRLWDGGQAGKIASIICLALILFEFLAVPYPMSKPDTPAWYQTLASDQRPSAVLNLPMEWDRPGYLLHQTVHGKPLAVAYISRNDPRTLAERIPVLQHFRHLGSDIIGFDMAAQGIQVLNDLGVRWVILDRYQMPSGAERAYTDAATAELFGSSPPVYQDDRITVYEVQPSVSAAPYLILGDGWEAFDAGSGTRSFRGSAAVTVRSPGRGEASLALTLASNSAPLDLPAADHGYVMRLRLEEGDNTVVLRSFQPDQRVIVASLALDSTKGGEAK